MKRTFSIFLFTIFLKVVLLFSGVLWSNEPFCSQVFLAHKGSLEKYDSDKINFAGKRLEWLDDMVASTSNDARTKNYIRYHQESLEVQKLMLRGAYNDALALLVKLEQKYDMMPTETFARAECLVALRDTAAARQSYIQSIKQGASLHWIYFYPLLSDRSDSLWYQTVVTACEVEWAKMPHYADGPNDGLATPISDLNKRHQFLLDSIGTFDGENDARIYQAMIARHDQVLDSMLKGLIPVPSIRIYGMNSEFETFLLHTSAELKHRSHSTVRRWLMDGLIYPRTYAICFDDLALEENRPFPYGFFMELKPEELAPGHQRRRAAIGMGDETLEKRRFHLGMW